jgi:hypothetical protein
MTMINQGTWTLSLLITLTACGGGNVEPSAQTQPAPTEVVSMTPAPDMPAPAMDAGMTMDAAMTMDAGEPAPQDAGMTVVDAGQPPPPPPPLSPEAMCLERAVDTCQECGCRSCLTELEACENEPGCIEIRDCAQEAGCAGIRCAGPCGDVIREHGGVFGDAIEVVSALGDCMNADCPGCLPE